MRSAGGADLGPVRATHGLQHKYKLHLEAWLVVVEA